MWHLESWVWQVKVKACWPSESGQTQLSQVVCGGQQGGQLPLQKITVMDATKLIPWFCCTWPWVNTCDVSQILSYLHVTVGKCMWCYFREFLARDRGYTVLYQDMITWLVMIGWNTVESHRNTWVPSIKPHQSSGSSIKTARQPFISTNDWKSRHDIIDTSLPQSAQ